MAGKGRSGPRPLLADPARRKRLVEAIRAGSTHELACKFAGISLRAFYDAMAKARAGTDFVDLLDELGEAEGAGAMIALATIRKAAQNGQWQAAAWILERRYPGEYGQRTVVVNQDGGPAPVLTEDERAERVLRLVDGRRKVPSAS